MAVHSSPVNLSYLPKRSPWREFDWPLLLLLLTISLWGVLTVVSATLPNDDAAPARPATTVAGARAGAQSSNEHGGLAALQRLKAHTGGLSDALKQVIWIGAGMTALVALALADYQVLVHLQLFLYGLNIGLLLLVLQIGRVVNGAKSWIYVGPFALQPAEFAKFAVIVTLAAFLCRRQARMRGFGVIVESLLYLAPVLLLILKQPDFGTMLAVLSIWFGMLFFGGARLSHLLLVLVLGTALFGAAWHFDVLKPHQKERLAVFLESDPSPRDAGYQIKQSQIAIGGGRLTGQGWGQGIQNRAGYVPEKTTDFIFAVVAEELGFLGAGLLLLAYLALLWRTASLAAKTENFFGALICGGFTALLAFHIIENLGMTMRVMPITGVPLPFFSYGGSSYIAFSLCAGLLQSIAIHRKRLSL